MSVSGVFVYFMYRNGAFLGHETLRLVHTYDASTSIRKSMCEPGQRKHKRKRKKENISFSCACACVALVHMHFFLCLYRTCKPAFRLDTFISSQLPCISLLQIVHCVSQTAIIKTLSVHVVKPGALTLRNIKGHINFDKTEYSFT